MMKTQPNSSELNFSLQTWRENFVRVILRGALVFGLIALVPSILTNTEPLSIIVYLTAYALLVAVTFMPFRYSVRAVTIVLLLLALSAINLQEMGIWGGSRAFLLSTVVFAAILLSPRAAIWVTVITLGMTALAGWALISGQMKMSARDMQIGSAAVWLTAGAVLLMLDALVIIGLNLLQSGFERAQVNAQAALTALEHERSQLEKRVTERTEEIANKTRQLEAASTVARKIAEIRDLSTLLNSVTHSIAVQFDFYHVGIFLLDENQQFAVLLAASSEGGRKMLEAGHRLGVGQTGIVGHVTGRGRPRVALDTGTDAVFFNNPHLPLTHSEMALPLIVRGQVIGAIDIQSEKINAFGDSDIEIMQTVADQLSIAIENTRLFTETEAIISQFKSLSTLQTRDAWANYLKRRTPAYQFTAMGIRPMTESRLDENARNLRVPIELRGNEIGVINLRRKETSPAWSNREQELAKEVADQVGLALDTSRLLEETQKNAARDQMIANVSSSIRETLDMESVLQTAAIELRKAFGLVEAEVRLNPPPTTEHASVGTTNETKKTAAGSNGKGDLAS
jgi:GAF domain-containing protein